MTGSRLDCFLLASTEHLSAASRQCEKVLGLFWVVAKAILVLYYDSVEHQHDWSAVEEE